MNLVSFQRPAADGWRYSPGFRTRYEAWGSWPVQYWNGETWEHVAWASSYAHARRMAAQERAGTRAGGK